MPRIRSGRRSLLDAEPVQAGMAWREVVMRFIVILAAAIGLVAGCGGGGGGSSFKPGEGEASPTGIWEGVITFDIGESQEVVGLIAETREAMFITDDGLLIWGTATSDGNALDVSYEWALPPGFVTPAGAFGGIGEITGTFVERVSIDGSFVSRSSEGEVFSGTVATAYNDLYEDGSSLAVVTGVWLDTETGTEVLSIDATGAVFSQDEATGCVLNGTILPIDTEFNAYDVSLILEGCADPDLAPFNGTRFDGLGAVGDDLQPKDTLLFGAHGEILGVPIAIRAEYRKM
jgi:hypothetical protein